jgi:hypothetical protein
MKLLSYFTLSVLAVLFLTTACQKDAADWTYSTDNTYANFAFGDLYSSMSGESNSNSTLRACANLTLSSTTFPITVTADFNGSTGCGDGRTRSGVVTAVYSGRWNEPGTTVTITTTDYTVNGYRVEGTNVITNTTDTTTAGNPKFRSVITNGKVTTPDSKIILYAGTHDYEWIAGSSTPLDLNDDGWQLTGNANGTSSSGKQYTANITTPVIKYNSCNWIQQGVVTVTPSNGGTGYSVNYGQNVCDAQAVVTYGLWTFNITMQ